MESISANRAKRKRDLTKTTLNKFEQKERESPKRFRVSFVQQEFQATASSPEKAAKVHTSGAHYNRDTSAREACEEKALTDHRNKLPSPSKFTILSMKNFKSIPIEEKNIPRSNFVQQDKKGKKSSEFFQTNSSSEESGELQDLGYADVRLNTGKVAHCCCVCCGASATVWCCECEQCLCTNCDNQRHDTVSLDSFRRPLCSHRVEYIIPGDSGLPILSPVLELAVFFGAVKFIRWFFLSHAGSMLTVDYFFESVCPIVQEFRRLVFKLDHALYPLLKGPLGEWCDTEDAFLKIFTDLWVRGILTHTDSFALLAMKVKSMFAALMIVILVAAPLFAIPYASLATLVRFLEITIFPNEWKVIKVFAAIIRGLCSLIWLPCRILGWCCKSTVFGCILMDNSDYFRARYQIKIPPKTGHRKRPTTSYGIADISVGGTFSRIARVLRYFYLKAHRAILGAVVTSVFFALACRLLLLSLPRCGSGLLWSTILYAEGEEWNPSRQFETSQCFSIDILARKFSERMGVPIPDLHSLGEQGRILQKMQDSTENDVLDDALQRVFKGLMSHIFDAYPRTSRIIVFTIFMALAFAGLIRRLMFWLDLQRREKYRSVRLKRLRNRQVGV